MFKIALLILASLIMAAPALAQQRQLDPFCESVRERMLEYRRVHLERYNELVKIANNGNLSDRERSEMAIREKIVDEAYNRLLLLSHSSLNGYTANCLEIHYELKQVGR